MGHEFAGTVAAVGAGVEGWSEGDAVCVYPFAPLDHLDIAVAMGERDRPRDQRRRLRRAGHRPRGDALAPPGGGRARPRRADRAARRRPARDRRLRAQPRAAGLRARLRTDRRDGAGRAAGARVRARRRGRAERASAASSRSGSARASALGLEGVHEAVHRGARRRRPRSCSSAPATSPRPDLAIELIAPEGTIALLGMLGEPVPISQLNVMLKEVQLRGSFAYRPGDFDEAVELLAPGGSRPRS